MSNQDNPFAKQNIEFHILQSFPVTCLNRDDVGAPKTAIVGGVSRARVSSQAWKRPVRLSLREFNAVLGKRTKLIEKLVAEECEKEGATKEQAQACGTIIEQLFIKKSDSKKEGKDSEGEEEPSNEKTDTLLFLSPKEVKTLAQRFAHNKFNPTDVIPKYKNEKERKKATKKFEEILGSNSSKTIDALDIALFGRMVAQAAELNVEAAASFAHAISTHKVSNEVEFFTALDDLQEEPSSAHMGSLEFNSATYYRYISLDLGQLWQTLAGEGLPEAVEAFTRALYVGIPSARQTTQSGASSWDYAKVLLRKGQRLQLSFDKPVRHNGNGYLLPSIEQLEADLAAKEKMSGSLFGKLKEYTLAPEGDFNVDDLVTALKEQAGGAV